MSEDQAAKVSTMDSKIKDITDFLKSSVLEPAETEKDKILENAKKEAEKIISEANKNAATIIANAKKEAEIIKHNAESALKIASKQSIDKLKMALEKEILTYSVVNPTKTVMQSEEFVKDFIFEFLKHYSEKGAFSIVLSDSLKSKLKEYIKQQIAVKGLKEITLSDESLPSGFAVVAQNGILRYDFTDESVVELLTEYIRPELREALFSKH